MKIELINKTHKTTVKGLYLNNGKVIGYAEQENNRLNPATEYYSLTPKYSREQIKHYFSLANN